MLGIIGAGLFEGGALGSEFGESGLVAASVGDDVGAT
jgi:hypothetical protein